MNTVARITKVLSKNDAGVGSTKGHGVLIPKDPVFQSFFPALDASVDNPATPLACRDAENGELVELTYRYYNKAKNEYRITGIAEYLRANKAVEGSRLSLSKTKSGDYRIKLGSPEAPEAATEETVGTPQPRPIPSGVAQTPAGSGPAEEPRKKKRFAMGFAVSFLKGWEVTTSN